MIESMLTLSYENQKGKSLDDDEKQILDRKGIENYVTNNDTVFKQVPSLTFINESGLYSLIMSNYYSMLLSICKSQVSLMYLISPILFLIQKGKF